MQGAPRCESGHLALGSSLTAFYWPKDSERDSSPLCVPASEIGLTMPAFLTQILGLLRASRSAAAHSPGNDAASAARGPRSLRVACGRESSRNFPSARTGSRGYPEAGGRLPGASNRSAANGAARPRGWQRDFRVRPSETPLPMESVDQSEASLKAALRFRLSRDNLMLTAAWPNG